MFAKPTEDLPYTKLHSAARRDSYDVMFRNVDTGAIITHKLKVLPATAVETPAQVTHDAFGMPIMTPAHTRTMNPVTVTISTRMPGRRRPKTKTIEYDDIKAYEFAHWREKPTAPSTLKPIPQSTLQRRLAMR